MLHGTAFSLIDSGRKAFVWIEIC